MYNVIMLSIVYPIVLWAYSYIKLLMSSTKAVMNSLNECTFFEKAAQLSDIVQDNKLNGNNDETFSINTICNCRSQYNKIICLFSRAIWYKSLDTAQKHKRAEWFNSLNSAQKQKTAEWYKSLNPEEKEKLFSGRAEWYKTLDSADKDKIISQ